MVLLIQPLRAGTGISLAADVQLFNLRAARKLPIHSHAGDEQKNKKNADYRFAFEPSGQVFEWLLHCGSQTLKIFFGVQRFSVVVCNQINPESNALAFVAIGETSPRR
ncbi:MAG: hypothetical protein ONA90_02405 [candidate division KSB1 bacterium]|nr:hypothetical protein [candidate division KSB1 bacterium]